MSIHKISESISQKLLNKFKFRCGITCLELVTKWPFQYQDTGSSGSATPNSGWDKCPTERLSFDRILPIPMMQHSSFMLMGEICCECSVVGVGECVLLLQVHRGCMVVALICTVIAFVLIFIHAGAYAKVTTTWQPSIEHWDWDSPKIRWILDGCANSYRTLSCG